MSKNYLLKSLDKSNGALSFLQVRVGWGLPCTTQCSHAGECFLTTVSVGSNTNDKPLQDPSAINI